MEGCRAAGRKRGTGKSFFDPQGQRGEGHCREKALDWCQLVYLPYCCVTWGKLFAPSGLQCP